VQLIASLEGRRWGSIVKEKESREFNLLGETVVRDVAKVSGDVPNGNRKKE